MNRTKKSLSVILTSFSLFTTIIFTFNEIAFANFEGYSNSCVNDGKDSDSDSDGSVDTDVSGVGGDWTSKGTKSYKVAKAIFDFLTKKEGFSGAGAAGAVAVANRESSFNPKIENPGGGVVGLFQWSGWGNKVNGDRVHSGGIINSSSDLTVEKEMKLTHYELHHNYSQARLKVGKATDPAKAAADWSLLYEGVAASDGQTKSSQITSDAQKAYKLFGGANISASSALYGATEASDVGEEESAKSDNPCQKKEVDDSDSNIVKIAKKLLGYFKYVQVHGESYIGSVEHPDKNGETDCSGFVWLVLKKAGYSVPNNMQWFTGTMEQDAKGSHKWLKQISTSEAKPGDVVIMNVGNGASNNGHTAILESKWKGDSTKIIQQTNNGKGVSEGTFKYSFYSLLQAGAKPVIARPVKK